MKTWTFAASDRVCGISIHAQAEGSTDSVDVAILAVRGDADIRMLRNLPESPIRVSLHTVASNGPPSGSTSLTVDGAPALVADFQQDDTGSTFASSPDLSDKKVVEQLMDALDRGHELTVTVADDRTFSVGFNNDDFFAKLMQWATCRRHGS